MERSAKAAGKTLPYLTEEQLNAPVKAIKIKIYGSYTRRGEQRKDVYEDDYEAEVEVPENFNVGHIKLAANRLVRTELKGIRARSWPNDVEALKAEAVPVDEKRKVKDFMSHQGLLDNQSLKKDYEDKQKRARLERERFEATGGQGVQMPFDNSEYGADGLPKFSDKLYVAQ